MKQLNNTIQRLTNNPNKSVTVTNLDTGEKIVCNKKGSFLIEEYGSIEEFFNGISASGVSKIRVSDRNPSGTSSTPDGEPYNVSLVPYDGTEVKQKATVLEQEKRPIMPALNGDFSAVGMNAAQVDIAGKLFNYPTMEADLRETKKENKAFEKELQELKTKLLIIEEREGKSIEKTKANKELIKESIPLMGMIMQAIKGNVAPAIPDASGLAGANLSAIKQQVVSLIGQEEDSTVFYIGKLIEKLSEDAVWADFEELLKKHNLAPKE